MTHRYLYAVYDADDRLIKSYATYTWAERKADSIADSRIETYIHERHKVGVEMAHYINRRTIK